jgi:hypothetical protein
VADNLCVWQGRSILLDFATSRIFGLLWNGEKTSLCHCLFWILNTVMCQWIRTWKMAMCCTCMGLQMKHGFAGVKRKTVRCTAGNKYRQFWAADLVQISTGSMFAFKFTAPKKNKFYVFFFFWNTICNPSDRLGAFICIEQSIVWATIQDRNECVERFAWNRVTKITKHAYLCVYSVSKRVVVLYCEVTNPNDMSIFCKFWNQIVPC